MAYLQLHCSNSNFSHVISKDPNGELPCIGKDVRQGNTFGWFSNGQTYNLFYLEPPEVNSYSDQKVGFSYLNTTALASPYVYLNLVSEFFRTPLKNKQELDIVSNSEILVGLLTIENFHYFNIFERLFPDYNINYEEISKDRYKVVIRTNNSIHELLNLACIFLLFAAVFDRETFVYAEEDLLNKYISCLEAVNVPYFIAYLFKINLVRSPENFLKVKEKLEESISQVAQLKYGNTFQQRKSWVRKKFESLQTEPHYIVDFGSGYEFNYSFLSRSENLIAYLPVDSDAEVRKEIDTKIQYKKLQKIESCYSCLKEATSYLVDINKKKYLLATEVLEHIEWPQVLDYCQFMFDSEYDQIFITLPNFEFNQFYDRNPGFRHEDHRWEPLGFDDDKIQQISTMAQNLGYSVQLEAIGDVVNNIPCTLGLVFARN